MEDLAITSPAAMSTPGGRLNEETVAEASTQRTKAAEVTHSETNNSIPEKRTGTSPSSNLVYKPQTLLNTKNSKTEGYWNWPDRKLLKKPSTSFRIPGRRTVPLDLRPSDSNV